MANGLIPPIPFVGTPNQRYIGTGDERYVNVLFERIPNDVLKEHQVFCVKRPGISALYSVTSVDNSARGIHAWAETGSTYSVYGNSIFANTSTLFSTMNTSSGKVWFQEIPQSGGNHVLIISDGQDNYNITSTGVITQIDQSDHSSYPTSTVGCMAYLDGYLFMAQPNGRIWNTQLNSVSSWDGTGFITADTHAGELEAIHLQKDQILAFTKNRIEFFFNNGNPTGSPLLRIDQNTIQVGLASRQSLAFSGEIACFVGENSGDGAGGRAVYVIASQKMRDISTPVINKFLDAEGPAISTCSAFMESMAGQLVYMLSLSTAARSFVYGFDTGLWSEWTHSDGSGFAQLYSATSINGRTYVQNPRNIYVAHVSTFTDSGVAQLLTIQTKRSNHGSPFKKYQSGLALIGDRTLGTVSTFVSDDDFQTSTFVGDINMASDRKYISRLGSFYERSYTFLYGGASTFRVQAYQPEIEVGKK